MHHHLETNEFSDLDNLAQQVILSKVKNNLFRYF